MIFENGVSGYILHQAYCISRSLSTYAEGNRSYLRGDYTTLTNRVLDRFYKAVLFRLTMTVV